MFNNTSAPQDQPPTPQTPKQSPTPHPLLESIISGSLGPLCKIQDTINQTLDQVAQWIEQPANRQQLASLITLLDAQTQLIICQQRLVAVARLVDVAANAPGYETTRRACADLLRIRLVDPYKEDRRPPTPPSAAAPVNEDDIRALFEELGTEPEHPDNWALDMLHTEFNMKRNAPPRAPKQPAPMRAQCAPRAQASRPPDEDACPNPSDMPPAIPRAAARAELHPPKSPARANRDVADASDPPRSPAESIPKQKQENRPNFSRTPLDTADQHAILSDTEQIDQNKGLSYVDHSRITKRNLPQQQEQIRREIDRKDPQQGHRAHG